MDPRIYTEPPFPLDPRRAHRFVSDDDDLYPPEGPANPPRDPDK